MVVLATWHHRSRKWLIYADVPSDTSKCADEGAGRLPDFADVGGQVGSAVCWPLSMAYLLGGMHIRHSGQVQWRSAYACLGQANLPRHGISATPTRCRSPGQVITDPRNSGTLGLVLEMLHRHRRRLIKVLWRLVVWPVAVLAAAVVGFSAYAVLTLAPLAPRHSLELKEEFEARRDGQLDFAELLALEGRLFDELRHANVLRSSDTAAERSSRFSPDSWVARLTGRNDDSGDVYTAPTTARSWPACRRVALAGARDGASWSAAHDPGGLACRREDRSPPRCFAGVP